MIRKFKKFEKLSFREKKLFLEAYVTVGIMRAAILTVPFKRLTRSLECQQTDMEIVPLDYKEMQTALSVGRAISRASAHTLWQSTCLAQSLTAQRMLARRGIPGVLYLGVAKNADDKSDMKAHSWSQCGEMIITGGEGHENFTVLSMFGWM
ncbi:MAG: lasso peptide biosynthesis B2 protein [Desulfobulbaceae bacterium]|nr:lasso peptide biosynthesis B2 protein [Desulfobulbaceae bacterium]